MTTVASPDEAATKSTVAKPGHPTVKPKKHPLTPARVATYVFLTVTSVIWLSPIVLLFYASLRPYHETALNGYFSLPHKLSFEYYTKAWEQGDLGKYFLNSFYIAVPGVLITLFLASFLAFALTKVRIPFRKTLLVLFTAGNLLPPQMMVAPLYIAYVRVPIPDWHPPALGGLTGWLDWLYQTYLGDSQSLYDSRFGVILIHVAFQTGFCVFVLYNYMLTIPIELTEASIVDGASVWRQYWQVILPVVRPALGALATLEFTWMYNDFLWGLVLMSTGDKQPVTTALNNLRGQFFVDYNLLAAGAMIVMLPTLIVFFALQRQFISGLTLGANKG